jgi:hypothetical protein
MSALRKTGRSLKVCFWVKQEVRMLNRAVGFALKNRRGQPDPSGPKSAQQPTC